MIDSDRANSIRQRLAAVHQRIGQAAARAGRDPSLITLVAVTKTHGTAPIRMAVDAGQLIFGENRVEEAGPKLVSLSDVGGLAWHMIGHVQSRKARGVVEAGFALVHSVDSLKLAERLGHFAALAGRVQAVLLEVNISGEASKAGFPAAQREQWPALAPEIKQIAQMPGLDVQGLMTMAPQVDQPELARPHFERLRQLRDFLADHLLLGPTPVLSMGMTDDFEVAIEAGATMVRIGRAIFGERG